MRSTLDELEQQDRLGRIGIVARSSTGVSTKASFVRRQHRACRRPSRRRRRARCTTARRRTSTRSRVGPRSRRARRRHRRRHAWSSAAASSWSSWAAPWSSAAASWSSSSGIVVVVVVVVEVVVVVVDVVVVVAGTVVVVVVVAARSTASSSVDGRRRRRQRVVAGVVVVVAVHTSRAMRPRTRAATPAMSAASGPGWRYHGSGSGSYSRLVAGPPGRRRRPVGHRRRAGRGRTGRPVGGIARRSGRRRLAVGRHHPRRIGIALGCRSAAGRPAASAAARRGAAGRTRSDRGPGRTGLDRSSDHRRTPIRCVGPSHAPVRRQK